MNVVVSATKILFFLSRLSKRIGVSAFLYALLGIVTAISALFVKEFIPEEITTKISMEPLENILTILASSMLAIATFSLSIMVIAFGHVSNSATPRATKLIIENQSAQRAVATFIGVFMYSIVGIIALATNLYGASGRFILFLVTIIVVIVIVVTLIKWVDQLSSLGQVQNTIAEIEKATLTTIKEYAKKPYLGTQRLKEDAIFAQTKQTTITSEKVGFIVIIDTENIQKICEDQNLEISILILPGNFAYPDRPLATVNKKIDQEILKSIVSHFVIENSRSFKQDPRFGFVLLSEIASRALSPGVNDPGTAIEIMGCATRLLKIRSDLIQKEKANSSLETHSRVFIRPLKGEELMATTFPAIIRDGANICEVGIKVKKCLRSLKDHSPEYQEASDFYAKFTELHFNSTLKTQHEKDLVVKASIADDHSFYQAKD